MAAIFKTCHTFNFYSVIFGFVDREYMGVDAKIVFKWTRSEDIAQKQFTRALICKAN